jgi:hypothetical protein
MVNLIRGRRLISLSNSARALSRLLPANSMRSIFVLSSVQSSTSLAMADPEYLPLREDSRITYAFGDKTFDKQTARINSARLRSDGTNDASILVGRVNHSARPS